MAPELNVRILGKLLLMQGTMHIMPDEAGLAAFISHGLSELPDIGFFGICLRRNTYFENLREFLPGDGHFQGCSTCSSDWQALTDPQGPVCAFEKDMAFSVIEIRTSSTFFGFFIIRKTNESSFLQYKPFLENTANLMALIIENKLQSLELTAHRTHLEQEVAARTRKLEEEIRERKKVEQRLLGREEELAERNLFIETLVNLSPDILYIYDLAEQKNIYSNDGVQKILGFTTEEILEMGDQLLPSLMHPDDFGTYLQTIIPRYLKAEDGEHIRHQYRMKDKKGVWHWIESDEVIYQRMPDGSPRQIFGVIYDITERRQLEEQLRHSEKMQAIGQLAGGIAHDFNNQLAGIMNFAEIVKTLNAGNSDAVGFLNNIITIVDRSAGLTRQLLAYSRKGKYQVAEVDLHDLISEVFSILERSIDKKVILCRDLQANPSTTTGDASQLQNAILNLALNARDAMEQGGELKITTWNRALTEQDFKDSEFNISTGEYIEISISDTGKGMNEEVRGRMFEPFFTTKAVGQGTGMGLAAVYGTIINHHGAISVESLPGRGTTMTMYLPLSRKTETPVSKPADTLPPCRELRILFVDDEEMMCMAADFILNGAGHKVTIRRNGREALAFYTDHWQEVDLVILDMLMPEMNGKEAFKGMKALNPEIKALMLSGYSMQNEAREALELGMLGFVEKPFTQEVLLEKINEAFIKA